MKHHLSEAHEHNFEIHNLVLSSQSISLRHDDKHVIRAGDHTLRGTPCKEQVTMVIFCIAL